MEGQGNYEITYGGELNRWGDYFGIYLDPSNNYDFWTITEYARFNNAWGTYVGRIRMKAYPGAYAYAESFTINFGDLPVGSDPITRTITLTNYGEENLEITNINSPITAFTLLTNVSLPLTIIPYDSLELEFEFNPTDPVLYEDLMSFATNDPIFTGFSMIGRGYEINQANGNTLYATSGANTTGRTLTLDKNTGLGTEVGLTEYATINTLTINPVTNVMYGVSSGNPKSKLIRVNATGGDAHTMYNFDLSFAVAVASDTNGTIYVGLQNGQIYTFDVTTGNYNIVTTTSIQLVALAFNPLTNDLWATPRVVIGQKDKIYKIDLNTGTATLVGETDFNVSTNDISFDETGTLYGIIGTETEVGKLITIDTANAIGTLIGEVGFDDVKGLAYAIHEATSVDDNVNILPAEFALIQNYPNPFNPRTKIEYRIADAGLVILKVYDILGNEVATLVNEQKLSGRYEVEFDASVLTSGVYFYQLKSGNLVQTKKMVLIK